jgi:hypothetical protein
VRSEGLEHTADSRFGFAGTGTLCLHQRHIKVLNDAIEVPGIQVTSYDAGYRSVVLTKEGQVKDGLPPFERSPSLLLWLSP